MMQKLVRILCCITTLYTTQCFTEPNPNTQPTLTLSLNDAAHAPTKGLISDLQSTLQETQIAIANFPQTLSSMLPTVSNIQKLLLSGAIIGLGYRCCKYGIAQFNKASKLYGKRDDTEQGKRRYALSKSVALSASSFFLAGTCMLLCAQRLANLVYR